MTDHKTFAISNNARPPNEAKEKRGKKKHKKEKKSHKSSHKINDKINDGNINEHLDRKNNNNPVYNNEPNTVKYNNFYKNHERANGQTQNLNQNNDAVKHSTLKRKLDETSVS